MTLSPLEFAREFAALKSKIGQQHANDTQLLSLADFWPRLAEVRDNQSYRSYFDEYRALIADLLTTADFSDCTPEELHQLSSVADAMSADDSHSIKKALIRLCCYLGEIHEAVNVALTLTGESNSITQDESTVPAGLVPPKAGCDLPVTEQQDLRSELVRLQSAIEQVREHAPKTAELLNQISLEWDADSGHLWFDRARCLFVESDGSSQSRGRMRTFIGSVERIESKRHSRDDQPDEVVFENQVKSADDPFIGVVYHALAAVRNLMNQAEGRKNPDHVSLKARYEIAESKQTVTGDSIGLASALIAYAQLLRPEILRYDRFVSSEVAFTGSISPDGRLLAVNHDSLATKLRRAFCSPIRYLVIPKACADTAETILNELRQEYPHRRLQLIAAEHLRDVVEDRNIVRTERVCIGQFVGRKASKWTRTTKVQVPLLMVLLYFLICLVYPRAWPGFDRHIARIDILRERVQAFNNNGNVLWTSQAFEHELDSTKYEGARLHWAVDSDGDGKDELFFVPYSLKIAPCLVYYDHNGRIVWRSNAVARTTYPGDTVYPDWPEPSIYEPPYLFPYLGRKGRQFVMTSCAASSPWRIQLMLFDTSGHVTGPFLSTGAGASGNGIQVDIDGNGSPEVVTSGIDNRVEGSIILALDPLNLSGVNPPYDDPLFLLSGMPKGSQLRYVFLPESPLSADHEVKTALCGGVRYDSTLRTYQLAVGEGYGLCINGIRQENCNQLPLLIWKLDHNFIPTSLVFADGTPAQMNDWMAKDGRAPIRDFDRLRDSLLSEVKVYHGESLVHHAANGIHFYSNTPK